MSVTRVFAWYEEGMRLFKQSPAMWCVLGAITLASEFGLQLIPGFGVAAAKVIVPAIECGMLIGAAALDNGVPLRASYALAGLRRHGPSAMAADCEFSALAVFAAEALAVYSIAWRRQPARHGRPEVNELSVARRRSACVAVGTPIARFRSRFVPFAALLGRASFGAAFADGIRGFVLNVLPLAVFGVLALLLVALGVLTYGVGLVAVFPLLSAASYAAWKDVFGVSRGTG